MSIKDYLEIDGRFLEIESPLKNEFYSLFKKESIEDKDASVKLMIEYFDSIGMQHKRSIKLSNLLFNSWNSTSEKQEKKYWALSNGFLPDRIDLYNLNRNNFKDYLSDFDYFLIHPINNFFAFWINDKVTLKYMLQAPIYIDMDRKKRLDLMPEYYLYIENDGHYSYLMDSPVTIQKDEDYLLNLAKEKKLLAMKPSNGAGGKGFIKLSYDGTCLQVNDKEISFEAFNELKRTLQGYIVTEYIHQHKDLDKVWPDSACTLRVIATKHQTNGYDGGKINVIVSYARFGTKLSNGASNLSSGGVGIPFDFNTGEFGEYFYRYKQFAQNGDYIYDSHPDTKVSLKGTKLPQWEAVRDSVYALCNHFSSLEYFGFDIIITDKGLKLCEINTHPSVDYEQVMCGPVFTIEDAKQFFINKLSVKFNLNL